MSIITKIFVGVGLLLVGGSPSLHGSADPIQEVRELYLLATSDEAAIRRGLDAVGEARGESSAGDAALLAAYEGALITLKAKYVFWPTTRMRHLNQGLRILDTLVAAHPDDSEIRYLRLMSCYYLPSFIGRGKTVREDFAGLAGTLPRDRAALPPELYRGISEFVIANGELSEAQIGALQAAIP